MANFWHRFLCLIGVRNDLDWAPPALGPEVAHPYMGHALLQCCEHCGGGRLHAIHKPPYDARRLAEVMGRRDLENRIMDYEGQ